MNKKTLKFTLILTAVLFLSLTIFTAVFFLTSYGPSTEALASLEDTSFVDVNDENSGYLSFAPTKAEATTGLIIYPGAKVEPKAYSSLASEITTAGYQVIIVSMPLNFAIFDSNAADEVISAYPNIKNWAIAGHSLGGVMAAKYASESTNIKGIAFYASYPQGDELKNLDLDVVSIYGSEDGVADNEKVLGAKVNLPSTTEFVEIIGGNHGQFGSYGEQSGDNPAKISNEDQIKQVAEATIEMLKKISDN